MHCPHFLSKKPMVPVGGMPLYLRILGERMSCDACLHHFFVIRFLGIFITVPAPKHSTLA